MEEEFELIPLSPIRKLEKRLTRIERSTTSGEMLAELMDIVKTNQQVVDNMAKANAALIERIQDLNGSVNKTLARMDDFINRIETSETAEPMKEEESEREKELNERIAKLEKRLNALLLTNIAKQRAVPRPAAPLV